MDQVDREREDDERADRSERLSIEVIGGSSPTLVVVGDLDAYTVGALEQELTNLDPGSDVRIDLSGVAFMDSSGIRVLVRLDNALREADRQLVLSAPSAPVLRLFELTALVGRFHIDPSAP